MTELLTLEEITTAGLCIGCGLCSGLLGRDRIKLVMTPEGRERPVATGPISKDELRLVNAICPGRVVRGADGVDLEPDCDVDLIWGPATDIVVAYAGDPAVRHQASSGGILTALGQFLVDSGEVQFVVHVHASETHPMRTERKLSFSRSEVLDGAGSRYGPAAVLSEFETVLARGEDFALIAKPCDISAVRNLVRIDPRVDRHMKYALSLVCGGASDLTKSEAILEQFGLREEELQLFRYRGFGNPGLTRIEASGGRIHEIGYQEMWEDEGKWMIQPRCRICPDAIGEAADIVVSDLWPGGGPTGEDEGFSGVLVRTRRGARLFDVATAAGAVIIERRLDFRDMDAFQPHHVGRKRAVWSRLAGMAAAGAPTLRAENLRIDACARLNTAGENLAEAKGARMRVRSGRLGEPSPRPRGSDAFDDTTLA